MDRARVGKPRSGAPCEEMAHDSVTLAIKLLAALLDDTSHRSSAHSQPHLPYGFLPSTCRRFCCSSSNTRTHLRYGKGLFVTCHHPLATELRVTLEWELPPQSPAPPCLAQSRLWIITTKESQEHTGAHTEELTRQNHAAGKSLYIDVFEQELWGQRPLTVEILRVIEI